MILLCWPRVIELRHCSDISYLNRCEWHHCVNSSFIKLRSISCLLSLMSINNYQSQSRLGIYYRYLLTKSTNQLDTISVHRMYSRGYRICSRFILSIFYRNLGTPGVILPPHDISQLHLPVNNWILYNFWWQSRPRLKHEFWVRGENERRNSRC